MSRPARATHGDYGYAKRHKCKCAPCRESLTRYNKQRGLERHRGIPARLDPAATRAIIERFMELGADQTQLAAAAGISATVIKNILGTHGRTPAKWVLRPTAARFEALTVDQVLSNKTYTGPVGVHRRLKALRAWGHSCQDIGDAIGVSEAQIYHYMYAGYVTTETVAKVDAAYQELRKYPGNCMRTVWSARRAGEPIPMCWDDDTIDDPTAEPALRRCVVNQCPREGTRMSLCSTHVREVSLRGGTREPRRYREIVISLSRQRVVDSATLREAIRDCFERGLSVDSAALHLGVSRDLIYKVRKEIRDGAAR